MIEVKFYDKVEDANLKFAVIIAKKKGDWILCKHKDRDTLEVPGGHREPGEEILTTAKRELYEETGAIDFEIQPVCVYSVIEKDDTSNIKKETYGMLYYAKVIECEQELHSEIEQIILSKELPQNWTYPLIQPKLIEEAQRRGVL